MKNFGYVLLAIILIGLAFAVPTMADDGSSDPITEWYRSDGSICSAVVTEYGVAIDCDCPCNCEFSPNGETPVPSETPASPKECYQLVCKKNGQTQCCPNQQCVDSHLKWPEAYLGPCE